MLALHSYYSKFLNCFGFLRTVPFRKKLWPVRRLGEYVETPELETDPTAFFYQFVCCTAEPVTKEGKFFDKNRPAEHEFHVGMDGTLE